jgi:Arc/MetJ family transcription regulator
MMSYIKKTIEIEEKSIKKIKKILNVKTDKDAVNLALKIICEEDELIKSHEKFSGQIELDDIFK